MTTKGNTMARLTKKQMADIEVLLSCLKAASRRQEVTHAAYKAAPSDESMLTWFQAHDDAQEWERKILNICAGV